MDCFEKYNIQVDDRPPYSPDLNVIRHVWIELELRHHRKYQDIGNTKGGPDNVKAMLAEVMPQMWQDIPHTNFEKLLKCMPDSIAAVIDFMGWYRRF